MSLSTVTVDEEGEEGESGWVNGMMGGMETKNRGRGRKKKKTQHEERMQAGRANLL